jgi:hypothetical protein
MFCRSVYILAALEQAVLPRMYLFVTWLIDGAKPQSPRHLAKHRSIISLIQTSENKALLDLGSKLPKNTPSNTSEKHLEREVEKPNMISPIYYKCQSETIALYRPGRTESLRTTMP